MRFLVTNLLVTLGAYAFTTFVYPGEVTFLPRICLMWAAPTVGTVSRDNPDQGFIGPSGLWSGSSCHVNGERPLLRRLPCQGHFGNPAMVRHRLLSAGSDLGPRDSPSRQIHCQVRCPFGECYEIDAELVFCPDKGFGPQLRVLLTLGTFQFDDRRKGRQPTGSGCSPKSELICDQNRGEGYASRTRSCLCAGSRRR